MKHRTPTLRPLNALLKQALHSRALRRAALGLGAFAPALALANPTGGQVVAGNASINIPDSDHTIVNQASQSAILNWQQFSIGSNQYVQFIQPDSSSVVLNRVIGGNPSQILGNLSANGQVFLVNPNGVFFGQGASLDVQGLIATTLDIKDSDFMAGHYVFAKGDGAPDAGVTNQGTLTANNGYIVLAGDYANNDGVIAAQAGQVVLASGNQMTLTLDSNSLVSFVVNQATMAQYAGVSNTGSIEADGGVVLMTAKVANALTATAVNNSGLIVAHSMQDHNGTIILAATGGDIDESGTLDASATDAGVTGGSVIIRGDGHTEIANTANILAQGDDATGGFIELSGHTLSLRGNVAAGRGGELLIDPQKIKIVAGSSENDVSTGTGSIGTGLIAAKLNAGSNVTIVASSSIYNSGGNSIKALAAPAANANLIIENGTVTASGGNCGYGGICIGAGSTQTISLSNSGFINLTGLTINIKGGLSVYGGSGYGSVTLGPNTTAANINITGRQITTGNLTATSAGPSAIKIAGTGSSDNTGYIQVNGNIIAANGGVNLTENGGNSIDVTGIVSAAGPVVMSVHGSHAELLTVGGAIKGSSVQLTVQGSGSVELNVGNVTATKILKISASDSSSAGSLNVTTGILTNNDTSSYVNTSAGVNVQLHGGYQENLQIGGITAKGPAGNSCECGVGNVSVQVNPNISSHASIHFTGAVKASHGSININGAQGKIQADAAIAAGSHFSASANQIQLANATAKSIELNGRLITVGNLTTNGASTNGISIAASVGSYGGPATIHTGALTATGGGNITLNQNHGTPNSSGGGSITVTGDINAAGAVHISASDTGYFGNSSGGNINLKGVTGKTVEVDTKAKYGANIIATSLHATGNASIGSVNLHASASSGSTAANGNINITGTGGITADHGTVSLQVQGGGGITVSGPINAGGGVEIGGGSHVAGFNLGDITAGNEVNIYESGVITGANTLKVGNVTAGSSVSVYIYQTGGVAKVTLGNVTAGSRVSIQNTASNTGNANLTVGNVTGTSLSISAHAVGSHNATINTGVLTAVNTTARAVVSVYAQGKNATITTGAITAQGVLTPFTSGHASTENPFYRDAANVSLGVDGSGSNAVTVNGGITLKGTAGHFHYSNSYGNVYNASGSTGQAVLAINGNSAGITNVKVTGAINATGVGYAGVDINAAKVTLGGAINLTATAGKMKQSGTLAYGSPQHIVYSDSGTKLGRAELLILDDSGASLGGAVTLKGPSAQLIVQGDGGITTRGISLTASGEKFTHKATGIDSSGHTVNYSSTESAGTAAVLLLAGSSDSAKSVKVQGNITVTGIGKAVVGIEGNTITTQSLTVTQAAGKYSRTGKLPSGVFSSSVGGPNQLVLSSSDQSFGGMSDGGDLFGFEQGTLNGGIAGVRLQGVSSTSYCNCETPATSITVGGSITVSAVGQGDVAIAGKTVNITGGITGTATRATANGSGMHSSYSDGFNYSIKHTANGSGGRMLVDIRGSQASGQSSGSHYNSDNNYTGTVTIGGAISLTGPTASVQIKSGTIKTGNISVNGTGENISVTDVYTPSEGSAFTLKRSGVIDWTGIELSGKAGTGKVTTGNLLAEGPLFAAIHISAGAVTVGNLGVIASSGKVTLLDTRISTTPLTFTAGDAGIAISTISSAGSTPVFGAATVNGNINVEAARDAHLLTNATVSGYVLVTAGGNIDDPLSVNLLRFINHDPHSTGDSSSDAPALNLSASALALLAGGNIILNDATLKVGTGSVPGVVGDSTGIALLATQGLVSAGTPPNATFVAGGELGLGKFTLTGDYLYMEASSYNLTGPISVPTQTVVQFAPVSLPGSIGVEPGTSTSSQLNLSGTLLNLFPGTTFLIGGTGTTGDMTIGSQGKITLSGGSNFLVETAGNVTGLDNILTTGLVGNLFELVNFQVPTASEIQNTSGTSDEKKKKTTNIGDNENGGSGGNVEQDDDTSGVCRG